MKHKLAISVTLLGAAAAAGVAVLLWPQSHHSNAEQWAVVKKYCFDCHNRDDMAGDRAFDKMSPDRIAADAEDVGASDPQAARRPHAACRRPAPGCRDRCDSLVAWLETEIDAAAADATGARPRLAAPPEPPRVRARDPRSARARRRCGRTAAAGQRRGSLRQQRRRAPGVARVREPVHRRRARDRAAGRRRPRRRCRSRPPTATPRTW